MQQRSDVNSGTPAPSKRRVEVNSDASVETAATREGVAPGASSAVSKAAVDEWTSPLLRRRVADGARFQNVALSFASDILRSEAARLDAQLVEDYVALLRGNAVYVHNFVCEEKDLSLYDKLKAELVQATGAKLSGRDSGLIEWSRHQVFENPTDLSQTFNDIIDALAEYFDVDVYASRLNYYRDGTQWKPQHHDSHAYGGRSEREDFTVGITLGSNRSLLFIHSGSGREFTFPQKNGDCFAFTGDVNKTFTHGVPRVHVPIGDRFSLIAWGRRRSLNERNGGVPSTAKESVKTSDGREVETLEDAVQAAMHLVSTGPVHRPPPKAADGESAPAPAGDGACAGSKPAAPKKKKNRLQ